jgi:hypothetical protein
MEQRSNVVEVYVQYLRDKIDRRSGSSRWNRAWYRLSLRKDGAYEPVADPARLTVAFALAMALIWAAARSSSICACAPISTSPVNQSLHARATALAPRPAAGEFPPPSPGCRAATGRARRQVLTPRAGCWTQWAGRAGRCSPCGARRATAGTVLFERTVPRMETTIRVLAVPHPAGPGAAVLAVGQSLGDRNEALTALVTSFIVAARWPSDGSDHRIRIGDGGPRPVEAMRRQAQQVSLSARTRGCASRRPGRIRRLGETLNDMLGRLRRSFERERQVRRRRQP